MCFGGCNVRGRDSSHSFHISNNVRRGRAYSRFAERWDDFSEGLGNTMEWPGSVLSDILSSPTTMLMSLCFLGMCFVAIHLKGKILHAKRNARAPLKAVLVVPMVLKPWVVLIRKHIDMLFSDAVQPYILCDEGEGNSSSSCPVQMCMPY